MAGTEDTRTDIFAEECDATASGVEKAVNVVIMPSGGVLYMCRYHSRLHGPELLAQGAVVSPLAPDTPPDTPPDAGQAAITAPKD
jgi:hypothetical protein